MSKYSDLSDTEIDQLVATLLGWYHSSACCLPYGGWTNGKEERTKFPLFTSEAEFVGPMLQYIKKIVEFDYNYEIEADDYHTKISVWFDADHWVTVDIRDRQNHDLRAFAEIILLVADKHKDPAATTLAPASADSPQFGEPWEHVMSGPHTGFFRGQVDMYLPHTYEDTEYEDRICTRIKDCVNCLAGHSDLDNISIVSTETMNELLAIQDYLKTVGPPEGSAFVSCETMSLLDKIQFLEKWGPMCRGGEST